MLNSYFHYCDSFKRTEAPKVLEIDPAHFTISNDMCTVKEREISKVERSFFYPTEQVGFAGRSCYVAHMADKDIYDLLEDEEGLKKKHSHSTYGLRRGVEWEALLTDIKSRFLGVKYGGGVHSTVVAVFEKIEAVNLEWYKKRPGA